MLALPDTPKIILNDMFEIIVMECNRILKLFDITNDTTTYKDAYKDQVRNDMRQRFERMLKMVMTIKQQKNVADQTPYTVVQLRALGIDI